MAEKWACQEGSPQQWRGEGSHLSCIKLCKVGMGESGRLRSDRAGSEGRHEGRQTLGPDEMSLCAPPQWPQHLQPAVNVLCYLHVRFYFLLLPAAAACNFTYWLPCQVSSSFPLWWFFCIQIHSTSPVMIAALCWLTPQSDQCYNTHFFCPVAVYWVHEFGLRSFISLHIECREMPEASLSRWESKSFNENFLEKVPFFMSFTVIILLQVWLRLHRVNLQE